VFRRDTGSVRLGLLVIAVVMATGACERTPGTQRSIVGVVVDVDTKGLGHVVSFELRRRGRMYRVFIDPKAAEGYQFPPDHLIAHLASSQPVRVGVEERSGRLYATTMADA
jgi:hypothetical protein